MGDGEMNFTGGQRDNKLLSPHKLNGQKSLLFKKTKGAGFSRRLNTNPFIHY